MSEQRFYHLYAQNTILFIGPHSLLGNTGQEVKSYVEIIRETLFCFLLGQMIHGLTE